MSMRAPTPLKPSKDVLAFRKAAAIYVQKSTKSQKTARSAMVKVGVHDAQGNLTKHYK